MSASLPHNKLTLDQGTIQKPLIAATLPPAPQPAEASLITQVPGYEVLGELGRGGMGVVYKARHLRLNRLVALKMILAGGHAGGDHLARFLDEAAAVARLQHPGIVQIYEVGEHNGLPYFSLEFCSGGNLSARLDSTPMPSGAAAALVEQLAQAMHHAHSAGIIHRDLKPANILLAEAERSPHSGNQDTLSRSDGGAAHDVAAGATLPGPRALFDDSPANPPGETLAKITDFGLAKQLDSGGGHTASGAIMGTPSYMAPEQAAGKSREVGPATDVYSLGAVLYECLTGRPPFRAATALDTMMQVLHQEPVPVRQLQPSVPRDLETICLKCLHKEPGRRYATAADLGADLRRFRAGEPVLARSISGPERLWRWCRKNPGLAAMATLSLLLLVGTLVSVTALYIRAEAQRLLAEASAATAQRALQNAEASATQAHLEQERAKLQQARAVAEADKANRVAQFIAGLFEASDPLGLGGFSFYIPKMMGEKLTAREILRRGGDKIMQDKQTPPLIRAAIHDTIGNVERATGNYVAAEKHLRAGLKLREESPDTDPLERARSLFNLAWLNHERGHYVDAEKLYREALAIRSQYAPDDHALLAASLMNLGWLLLEMQEFAEAETLFKEAIERRRKVWGDDNREVAIARIALAALYLDSGEAGKAAPLTVLAVRVFQEQEGNASLGRAAGLFQTAVFKTMVLKNHQGAEADLLEALRMTREGLGDAHPYLCYIYGQLGETLKAQKKFAEAEKWWRLGLEVGFAQVGPEHPKMLLAVKCLADLLVARKAGEEAVPLYEQVLKAHRARFGDKHPFVGNVLAAYAGLLWDLDRFEERDRAWQEAIAIFQSKPGTPPRQYSETLNYQGVALSYKDDNAAALKKYQEALTIERKLAKPRPYLVAQFQNNVASVRMNLELYDAETEGALRASQQALDQLERANRLSLQYTMSMLYCRFFRHHGRHREVATAARQAAALYPNSSLKQYDVAVEFARCETLVRNSSMDSAQEKAALQTEYHRAALTYLKQAVERGYRNVSNLKTQPDWATFRQDKEFNDLVSQAEKKVSPPK